MILVTTITTEQRFFYYTLSSRSELHSESLQMNKSLPSYKVYTTESNLEIAKTSHDTKKTLSLTTARTTATTATHSRVIRLRRVLTDLPPSGSSIDPASVAV